MPTVRVHQAKTQLSRLLARVEAGEEFIIARGSEAVARLTAVRPRRRRRVLGSEAGRIRIRGDLLAPLPKPVLSGFEPRSR